jgi:DNA-binding transcriptional ArsR family regulator
MCVQPAVDSTLVAGTRTRVIGQQAAQSLADWFSLMGDPNRVRIVFTLLEAGEMCVCDLAETVGMSTSAVSHALRLLRNSGMVVNRRAGKTVQYRLADGHVRLLLDVAREHLDHQGSGRAAVV